MTSDYRKYSNQDLKDMCFSLYENHYISKQKLQKFLDSIFKRHHDKLTNDEDRREAQKKNAIQWYYRKQLIKLYQQK